MMDKQVQVSLNARRVLLLADEDERKYVALHLQLREGLVWSASGNSFSMQTPMSKKYDSKHTLTTGDELFIDSDISAAMVVSAPGTPPFLRIMVTARDKETILHNWRMRLLWLLMWRRDDLEEAEYHQRYLDESRRVRIRVRV